MKNTNKISQLRSGVSQIALGTIVVAAGASAAVAGPEDGVIKGGQGTITTQGNLTKIDQDSDRLLIDWRSFDIEVDETVRFAQPDAGSVALNRVNGDTETRISGALEANGNVWIVNQHGVTFNGSARVDVGGLLATTADISDENFMAGRDVFDRPGQPGAKVVNKGHLTVGEVGLTALIGSHVENHGVIEGELTNVVLGGADTFAVDLSGDGLIAFQLDDQTLSTENGPLVQNTGQIITNGGKVLLTAEAAAGLVEAAVSGGGEINVGGDGVIAVDAGDGRAEVSGVFKAVGDAGRTGGAITVTGEQVHLTSTARIDASGDAGGGSIKLGGAFQGGPELRAASRTLVSSGVEINASATGAEGDGGEVIVWADEATGFFGSIRATGGANAGDGGFAEVSGKQQLAFDGFVDLSALNGLPGELLLDPENITIVAEGDGDQDNELNDDEIAFGDFDGPPPNPTLDFTISSDVLVDALENNSVTLRATRDINVTSAVNSTTATTTLIVQAGDDINLNAPLSHSGTIVLNAGAATYAEDLSATLDPVDDGDDITDLADRVLTFGGMGSLSGGNIVITTEGDLQLRDVNASLSLSVTAGPGANADTGNIFDTGVITSSGTTSFTAAEAIVLDNGSNDFASAVDADFSGTSVTVVDDNSIQIGTVALTATDGVASITADNANRNDIGGVFSAPAGASATLELIDAVGDVILGPGLTVGPNFTSFSQTAQSGSITVDGVNALPTIEVVLDASTTVSFDNGPSAFSALTVTAGGDVTQTAMAPITAGSTTITANGADIALNNTANNFSGTVTLTGEQIDIANTTATVLTLGPLNSNDNAVTMTPEGDATVTGGAIVFDGVADVEGNLTVNASGSVTQTQSVTVAGSTDINATGQIINLGNANNDFNEDEDLMGRVDAEGSEVTLRDVNELQLGEVIAMSTLTITAGGSITDTDGVGIDADGVASFTCMTAGGACDILLDNEEDLATMALEGHSFAGAVTLIGEDITVVAAEGITLARVTTTSDAADDTINVDMGAEANDPGELIIIARGGAITDNGATTAISVTGDAQFDAISADGSTYFDISLTQGSIDFNSDRDAGGLDSVGDGDTIRDHVTFVGATVTITAAGDLYAFDSIADTSAILTSTEGDLRLQTISINTLNGPLVGIAADADATEGVISAYNLSGGVVTLGGAGTISGTPAGATGAITVENFDVDQLLVASDLALADGTAVTLVNGDAGSVLSVAGARQVFNFVTVDPFTDDNATDFSAVTGSTAQELVLERMFFDGDITVTAGDISVGHLVARDALTLTATTGDVAKRPDGDIDFAGATTSTFTVTRARDLMDTVVGGAQSFADLLIDADTAATISADSGDIVLTRGFNGGAAKHNDFTGPLALNAVEGFVEDANSLVLTTTTIDDDLSIRINSDNANAGNERLTQTGTISVGASPSDTEGVFGILTGVGDTDRSLVYLNDATNVFDEVQVVADDAYLRAASGFNVTGGALTGSLVIGTETGRQAGPIVIEDVSADGDLTVNTSGALTISRSIFRGTSAYNNSTDRLYAGTKTARGAYAAHAIADGAITVQDFSTPNGATYLSAGSTLDLTRFTVNGLRVENATTLTLQDGENTTAANQNLSSSQGISLTRMIFGGAANVSAGGDIVADGIRTAGNLTLNAADGYNVTLGSVSVGGDFDVIADNIFQLADSQGSFTGVGLNGVAALTIGETIDVALGQDANTDNIDDQGRVFADTAAVSLGATSGVTFTNQVGVVGTTDLYVENEIRLSREAPSAGGLHNDFGGAVSIKARDMAAASTGNVYLSDANTLTLDDVMVTGDVSIRVNSDNVNGAGEALTQTTAADSPATSVYVRGELGVISGVGMGVGNEADVALDKRDISGAAVNRLGSVRVIANDVTLSDADGFTMDAAYATGNVDLTTTGADEPLTAGDITLSDAKIGGNLEIDAFGAAIVDQVNVGGTVTGEANDEIVVTDILAQSGLTTLTSNTSSITLSDFGLQGFALTAATGVFLNNGAGAGSVIGSNYVRLHNINLSGGSFTSTGDVVADGVYSTGSLTLTADSDNGLSGDLILGSVDVQGDFTASGDTIKIIDAILDPNGAGGATTDIAPATGAYLAANESSPTVTVGGVDALTVGAMQTDTATGDQRVFQDMMGTIATAVGGHDFTHQILVTGDTVLRASTSITLPREQDVAGGPTLPGLDNDLQGEVDITGRTTGAAVSGDVFLSDANSLILDDVNVGGNLSIRINADNTGGSSESLTQTDFATNSGTLVSVGGVLSVITGLDEDETTLDFDYADVSLAKTNADTGAAVNLLKTVRVIGDDVTISDADNLVLDRALVDGALTVATGGAAALSDTKVGGSLGVTAGGSATVTHADVGDAVTVTAVGAVDVDDLVAPNATTTLSSTGASVSLTRAALQETALDAATFVDVDNVLTTGGFAAMGGDIDLLAADLQAGGAATATGMITVDAVRAAADLGLTAGGDVLLGSLYVDGALLASGQNLLITDAATGSVASLTINPVAADRVGASIDPVTDDPDFRMFQTSMASGGETLGALNFDHQVEVMGMTDLLADQSITLPKEQDAEGGLNNNFHDVVTVTSRTGGSVAEDVFLSDANSLQLGFVDVAGEMTVRVNANNSVAPGDSDGAAIDAGAGLTQTADGVMVGGVLSVITGRDPADASGLSLTDVTLGAASNDFSIVRVIADDVVLTDANGITVDRALTGGDLTVTSGGDVGVSDAKVAGSLGIGAGGSAIVNRADVGGSTSIQAQDEATVTDLEALDGSTVVQSYGSDVTVARAALAATTLTAAGNVDVDNLRSTGAFAATGGIIDLWAAELQAGGTATAAENITVNALRAGADLELSAGGDVLFGSLYVGGALSASGQNLLITDAATANVADAIVVGVTAGRVGKSVDDLTDDADRRVFQTSMASSGSVLKTEPFDHQIKVTGTSDLDADQNIYLPRQSGGDLLHNDFVGAVSISAANGDVAIEDAQRLIFSDITVLGGDLAVRTNSNNEANAGDDVSITQTGAITVSGASSFITGDHGGAALADGVGLGDILLNFEGGDAAPGNAFTGGLFVIGDNAELKIEGASVLANSRIAGDLTLMADDAVTVADTNVAGDATVDAAQKLQLNGVFIGGALTASSTAADIEATDLFAGAAAGLTAATDVAVIEAMLGDTTVSAGGMAALSRVTTTALTADSVTGTKLSETRSAATTLTGGPVDVSGMSADALTITLTNQTVDVDTAVIVGGLTIDAGNGAVDLADVDVGGNAIIAGGDADGARMRVEGTLDIATASTTLSQSVVVASTKVSSDGDVSIDSFSLATLDIAAGGAINLSAGQAGDATLMSGGALDVANARLGSLDADAGATAAFTAVSIAGDAEIDTTAGDIRLGGVEVGATLDAAATAGNVETFGGSQTLAALSVEAPAALSLPAYTIDGSDEVRVGLEVALPTSPDPETRVLETVASTDGVGVNALTETQREDVSVAGVALERQLAVGGATDIDARLNATITDAAFGDTLAIDAQGEASLSVSATTGAANVTAAGNAGVSGSSFGASLGVAAGETATVSGSSVIDGATVAAGSDASVASTTVGGALDVDAGGAAFVDEVMADGAATVDADGAAELVNSTFGASLGVAAGETATVSGSSVIDGATVAAGSDASVASTTVDGALDVDAGGAAFVDEVMADGAATVDSDGAAELVNSTFGASLGVAAGETATVSGSSVIDGATVAAGSDALVTETTVGGALDVDAGGLAILGVVIADGAATVDAGAGADVVNSTLGASLGVTAGETATVSGTTAVGAATVTAATDATVIETTVGGALDVDAAGGFANLSRVTADGATTVDAGGGADVFSSNLGVVDVEAAIVIAGANASVVATTIGGALGVDAGADASVEDTTVGGDTMIDAGGDIGVDGATLQALTAKSTEGDVSVGSTITETDATLIGGKILVTQSEFQTLTVDAEKTVDVKQSEITGPTRIDAGEAVTVTDVNAGDVEIGSSEAVVNAVKIRGKADNPSTFSDLTIFSGDSIDIREFTAENVTLGEATTVLIIGSRSNQNGENRPDQISGKLDIDASGDVLLVDLGVTGDVAIDTVADIQFDEVVVGTLNVGVDSDDKPNNFSVKDASPEANGIQEREADTFLVIRSGDDTLDADESPIAFANTITVMNNITFEGELKGPTKLESGDIAKGENGPDLRLEAGGAIRFGAIVGGKDGSARFGDITIIGSEENATVAIGDVSGDDDLLDTINLENLDEGFDIFFATNLSIEGEFLRFETTRDVNTTDQTFFAQQRNFGVNISDSLSVSADFSTGEDEGLDLTGSINDINTEQSALRVESSSEAADPTKLRFNNCTVGDASDCGVSTLIDFTPDTDLPTPEVLELNIDELADVYSSGGNEELWALPPAFTEDYEEEE